LLTSFTCLSVFFSLDDVAQADILAHFVDRRFLPSLAAWWVKTLEQQGVTEHDACNHRRSGPFFGRTNSILRDFVGAWETLKNERFPPAGRVAEFGQICRGGRYLRDLHATAAMVIECVHRGDKTALNGLLMFS